MLAHWPKICGNWKPLGLLEPSGKLRARRPDQPSQKPDARPYASMHVPAGARTNTDAHTGDTRAGRGPGGRRGPGLAWRPSVAEALRTRTHARTDTHAWLPRRSRASARRSILASTRRRRATPSWVRRRNFFSWILREAVEMLLERGGRSWPRPGGGARPRPGFAAGIFFHEFYERLWKCF